MEKKIKESTQDQIPIERIAARLGGIIVFRGARQVAVTKRNKNLLNFNKPYVAHFYDSKGNKVEKVPLPDNKVDVGSL